MDYSQAHALDETLLIANASAGLWYGSSEQASILHVDGEQFKDNKRTQRKDGELDKPSDSGTAMTESTDIYFPRPAPWKRVQELPWTPRRRPSSWLQHSRLNRSKGIIRNFAHRTYL